MKKEKEHELDRLKDKELLMDKREEWIDWLNHHNKNVDDYLKITEMKERRRVIDYYIDKITLDWNDTTKQHTINIHYKYPIIGDGLVRKGGKLNWDEWGGRALQCRRDVQRRYPIMLYEARVPGLLPG